MIKIFRKLRKVFENIVQLSLKKVYKATAIFVVAFLVFFTAVIPIIAASRVTTTPNISGTNVTVRWNQNTSFYWVGNTVLNRWLREYLPTQHLQLI